MSKPVAKTLPIQFGRKVFYVSAELALEYYKLGNSWDRSKLARKKMALLKKWGVWEHKAPVIEFKNRAARLERTDESHDESL